MLPDREFGGTQDLGASALGPQQDSPRRNAREGWTGFLVAHIPQRIEEAYYGTDVLPPGHCGPYVVERLGVFNVADVDGYRRDQPRENFLDHLLDTTQGRNGVAVVTRIDVVRPEMQFRLPQSR